MTMQSPQQALGAALSFKTPLAMPTLAYSLLVLGGYATTTTMALTGALPLLAACVLNTVFAYMAYTIGHEGLHGNITDRRGRWGWLNDVLGFCGSGIFLHSYSLHKSTHLAHHLHTYDADKDADHWVAGGSMPKVWLRCATILISHYSVGYRLNKDTVAGRVLLRRAALENAFWLLLPLALLLSGRWQEVLLVFVLPAWIAATLLAYMLDYSVHYPKQGSGKRFDNARIYTASGWKQRLLTAAYTGQNYHLIHHLYPWVPFYRYGDVFRQVQPVLRQQGSAINEIL